MNVSFFIGTASTAQIETGDDTFLNRRAGWVSREKLTSFKRVPCLMNRKPYFRLLYNEVIASFFWAFRPWFGRDPKKGKSDFV
jgi:hypothetical protein